MFKTLLTHEILNLLKSRRVYLTVLMLLLLYATVFIVRVIDYQKQLNQYIADVRINEEGLQNAVNYSFIKPMAILQPIIFSIYNQGYNIPRVATIQFYEPIVETKSLNETSNMVHYEDTQLDITFLITFFLSLFILLISYDSVNSEKRDGTLRILLTYPIKRQAFILKKILGVFIFVAITFTLPYTLSLISLMVIYANLLTINFFISAFFYWFMVLLFIFFFTLLGVFISTCTPSPNRSLVYALFVWILLSIILPISWDYIVSPSLYHHRLTQLERNYEDKYKQLKEAWSHPEGINMWGEGCMSGSGNFYETTLWTWKSSIAIGNRYLKYVYENYYPVSRETEQVKDDVLRKRIDVESVKNLAFFFDPIVLFGSISNCIAGNSQDDLVRFLHSTREIRDELVQIGVNEGWLFDRRFYSLYKEEYDIESIEDIFDRFPDWDDAEVYIEELQEKAEPLDIIMPTFRRFEQPLYTLGEVFTRIYLFLGLFVGSILVLWVMTWARFMGFDVR